MSLDVVETQAEAPDGRALLVLEPLRAFFDEHGLGRGDFQVARIGEGSSNVTFLIERSDACFVLRRPPRPPLPPSTHDVVREARLQLALEPLGLRVPHIVAVCEDAALIGGPFYVMDFIEGDVLTNTLPAWIGDDPLACRGLVEEVVDALVEIHAVDSTEPAVAPFVRPGSYLERQVRRFGQLWELNATREIPAVVEVGAWLAERMPEAIAPTVVHGDYRLGNVIFARGRPPRLAAVLDWEMGAVGDPRADVGYLLATYTDEASARLPLELTPVTGGKGFPSRQEVLELYCARSGRDVDDVDWFEALALWKGAVFCEAIHSRYLRGELDHDAFAATLGEGVPALAAAALAAAGRS